MNGRPHLAIDLDPLGHREALGRVPGAEIVAVRKLDGVIAVLVEVLHVHDVAFCVYVIRASGCSPMTEPEAV